MTLPGPRFRLWSTWQLMTDPLGTYGRWAQQYGRTYLVPAVNGDVVATGDPEVIRDLFRADDEQVGPFRPDVFKVFLGPSSLFALAGEPHRRERKLLMPPFHGARMRAYGEQIVSATEEELAGWRVGETRALSAAMLEVSLQVILRAVFGVVEREAQQALMAVLRENVEEINPLALFVPALQTRLFPPWSRFLASRKRLDDALFAEIARRRGEPRGEDILSLMLDATYEDGAAMTDEAIRDELLTLLFAGHETTQITMAWALYLLHGEPEALARLVAELEACDGSPAALAALPFLDAVVQETLRIDPIVPDVLRTLRVPLTLGGLALPAGTHVAPLAAVVHRDQELYPEPERFVPARFLGRTYRPWEFLPFGGGTRRCIGAALATYEMKLVLGTLLRRVRLERAGLDRMVRRSVTLAPEKGVRMKVLARV